METFEKKTQQGPTVPYAQTVETKDGQWVDVRLIQSGAEGRATNFKAGRDGQTTLAFFPKGS